MNTSALRLTAFSLLGVVFLGATCFRHKNSEEADVGNGHNAANYEKNTGAVTGQIIDSTTNEPLVGVSVNLKGTTVGALTDLNGRFRIVRITPGTHTLALTYIGYKRAEISVDIQSNRSTEIQLAIVPQAIDTKAQTVVCVLRPTELRGAITDRISGLPIKKAKVKLNPGDFSTKTNARGEFRLGIKGGGGVYDISSQELQAT
jgi:hypothetical protein